MIGRVENLHVILPVTFHFPDVPNITVDFVVDTGYTGYLTLPLAAVTALGLPFEFDVPANLADDTELLVPVHAATILWNGAVQTVPVLVMGKRPLLGTGMLNDNELLVQFRDGGLVTIDPI